MTVLLTLTTAGLDSGPFNLYSNLDGYVTAFETGVLKSALVGGYSSSLVPDYTTTVRIKSTGTCTNYIDVVLSSMTTTTTTTIAATTTTTTTAIVLTCEGYTINTYTNAGVNYTNCNGDPETQQVGGASGFDTRPFCALNGEYTISGDGWVVYTGPC